MAQEGNGRDDGVVVTAATDAPSWYPDPYFLGRERYWDGLAWTEQCRITGTQEVQPSAAPRPAKDPASATPSALAARRAARPRGTATATAAIVATVAATAPASVASPEPAIEETVTVEETLTVEATTSRPAELVASERVAAGVGAQDDGWEYEDGWTPPNEETIRRTRRRFLTGVVVVVVLAAAVGLGVLVSAKKGNPSAANEAGPIAAAAAATVGQRYAQTTVGVRVSPGEAIATTAGVSGFSANGAVDLASASAALTLSGPGSTASEPMVLDGQTIYLEPGQLVTQLQATKSWVSATAADLGAVSSPSGFVLAPTLFEELVGSPTTMLQQLEASGNRATDVRALIYQGTPVEEYAVTLSPQAIARRLDALPPSLRAAVSNGGTEDVYLTTNGLVRAISVPFTLAENGTTVGGQVALGLTAWGDRADVRVPPADQVVTWAQLKAALLYASTSQ